MLKKIMTKRGDVTIIGVPKEIMPGERRVAAIPETVAKLVIVCNYDDKPGYAGVANSLYQAGNAQMLFGDAASTVQQLIKFTM